MIPYSSQAPNIPEESDDNILRHYLALAPNNSIHFLQISQPESPFTLDSPDTPFFVSEEAKDNFSQIPNYEYDNDDIPIHTHHIPNLLHSWGNETENVNNIAKIQNLQNPITRVNNFGQLNEATTSNKTIIPAQLTLSIPDHDIFDLHDASLYALSHNDYSERTAFSSNDIISWEQLNAINGWLSFGNSENKRFLSTLCTIRNQQGPLAKNSFNTRIMNYLYQKGLVLLETLPCLIQIL